MVYLYQLLLIKKGTAGDEARAGGKVPLGGSVAVRTSAGTVVVSAPVVICYLLPPVPYRAGVQCEAETLNELLEQEAEKLTQAARYERNEARQGYRSGHYNRNLTTTSGDVTLHVPRLKGVSFETAIIERYRRRESKVSPATISELNKKAYVHIEDGIEETLTYCDFPSEHWTRIRTNNVIERLNREIRRRTRVVGCFPVGQQEVHKYEALRGYPGRRFYCRLTLFCQSLQTILRIILDNTPFPVSIR